MLYSFLLCVASVSVETPKSQNRSFLRNQSFARMLLEGLFRPKTERCPDLRCSNRWSRKKARGEKVFNWSGKESDHRRWIGKLLTRINRGSGAKLLLLPRTQRKVQILDFVSFTFPTTRGKRNYFLSVLSLRRPSYMLTLFSVISFAMPDKATKGKRRRRSQRGWGDPSGREEGAKLFSLAANSLTPSLLSEDLPVRRRSS